MRQQILSEGKRVDGRSLDEVRPIQAAAGVLPKRVHGSGLFQRGLTQVLSCATLGTPSDAQEMDDLNPQQREDLPPPLQLPPLLGGRDTPDALPRSPGDRPRRPRRTGPDPGAALQGELPLRAAGGVGVPQLQRLHLHGFGVRQHPGPDGCRRAARRPR